LVSAKVSTNDVVTDVVLRLQDMVLENRPVADFLQQLAGYSADWLSSPGRDVFCGISIASGNGTPVMASSNPCSRLMDQLEMKYGVGPALTAMADGTTVTVPDLRAERRWPEYVRAAAGLGFQSLLAVPLALQQPDRAVLTLYGKPPSSFGPEDTGRAELFAGQASKSLRLALRLGRLQDTRDNMSAAMNSRTVIDLATGAIMAKKGCSQAAAFQVLLRASNTRNIKLRDVAATVVTSVSGNPAIFTHFAE